MQLATKLNLGYVEHEPSNKSRVDMPDKQMTRHFSPPATVKQSPKEIK